MQIPAKQYVASFDVDAQRTFTPLCPDELPVEEGDTLGPELNRQAGFAAVRLGSKDAHSPDAVWVTGDPEQIGQPGVEGDNVEEHWPVHAVPGTEGFELIPELPRPTDYDFFVWKGVELDMHPYGACFHDIAENMSTGVVEWLRSREISHVLVGGLATDFCVWATARQLQEAGFQVILNMAACRGIADESVEKALSAMREVGVEFVESCEALEQSA